MSRTAAELLPELLDIIWSDLMKANHYLDEAIRVSLIADPDITAQQHTEIARISQMVALQVKYIEHLRERLAAPSKQGEEPR